MQIIRNLAELKLEMDPLQHIKCPRKLAVDYSEE